MTTTPDETPSPGTISGVPLPEAIGALRLTLLVALAVVLPLVALACASWSGGRAADDLRAEARGSLAVFRANLVAEIEKNEAVPFLLARSHEVASLLAKPSSMAVDALNRRLDETAEAVHASAIYVIDADGNTVAASNWATEASFVGKNFSYRPYFQAARAGGVGRYFALGTASRQPGYYIAHPVGADGQVVGAVVIKVGMERLEQAWAGGPERVMVTDADGVVVITDTAGWRFHGLFPLSPADLARVDAGQQYAGIPIAPLPVTERPSDVTAGLIGIEGARYVMVSGAVPGTGWTARVLIADGPIRARSVTAAVIGASGTLIVILGGFQLLQRWSRRRERLADQERAREDLERRVRERTADLAEANARLRTEMRERERAEEETRAAQGELVQAAKLAALGQMSAGIAHEINQPLSAIRAFADNAVILLDRGRADTARDNLAQIGELTQRMAGITQQLKGFARTAAGTVGAVAIHDSIDKALALIAHRLRTERVRVARPPPAGGLPPMVLGEDVRLQQVLVNLFGNALDAMADASDRVLTIGLEREGDAVVVTVGDTGPGIDAADLPLLFEPFFTTKGHASGLDGGLGLGLSISSGIVQDFGGAISAANRPDGGAEFTLRLRSAETPS